jgi:hypothetical protein
MTKHDKTSGHRAADEAALTIIAAGSSVPDMAITAELPTQQPAQQPAKRATDPFGGGIPMALVALAVTGIGFWKRFFSQLDHVDAAHLLHGGITTGWLVLVLVQASLVRSRKFRWHRTFGWASLVIFTVFVVTSCQMIALMLSGKSGLPFPLAKLFGYSDITTLPLLVVLYGGSIILRKDRHVHSRLVSATLLVAIIPAAARMFNLIWPGMDGLVFSMHPTFLFSLGILGIAIFADWRKGRLRWPFPFAFGWLAITYASLFPALGSQWYDHLARAIGALA